ncbi:hypothetical protein [Deinococcus peraridilitoris]|uniref:hypothetical protein n=1 Tax=Deinococcus peraridilitoris TaxID=432329 RepID=UPI0002D43C06|nr:hypothetical protein [Deinococcus peraridilitoris]
MRAECLTPKRLLEVYVLPDFRRGWQQGRAVATMILQDAGPLFWPEITDGRPLFLRELPVAREVAGLGLALQMLQAARLEARGRHRRLLRLDTAA